MKPIFWNVDTQFDFMSPNGALYVQGAIDIIPNLKALTEYARGHEIRVIGSVDAHAEKDSEMQANGGPFPFHCMVDTPGQKHIPETEPKRPLFVQNREYSDLEIEKILAHEGEIFFEKQHYDVFTNPNAGNMLERICERKAVVYGVATDYCVKAAALGLRKRKFDVYLMRDAIKPVTCEDETSALKEMREVGVRLLPTAEVLRGRLL